MKGVVAAVAVGTAVAAPWEQDVAWNSWKLQFGRQYPTLETEQARYYVWKSNEAYIVAQNALGSTYTMQTNDFSDQAPEEFAYSHFGLNGAAYSKLPRTGVHKYQGEALASEVDWVAAGAVTPVKNQGQCGSCWSFSTTGGLEGAWEIASGSLVSVSEQQFVDCSKQNSGCNGGLMDYAFSFAEGVSLCSEASYPYTAADGTCAPGGCTVVIPKGGVTAYTDVDKTEAALVSALNQQPVSIAIEADKSAFQSYSSGVLQDLCGTQLDHGVLAVGYGVDAGVKYWKVKNSWGGSWGESGYIRLLRGKGGMGECGILSSASYPTVNANAPPSPAPAPTPSPSPSCQDTSSFCSELPTSLCSYFASECQKTCGCCGSSPPSYCSADVVV
jgi:C1A family cysteine protease